MLWSISEYGITAKPTGKALAIAIRRFKNRQFYEKLNALLRAQGVSHFDIDGQFVYLEDDGFDYYLADAYDESYDGDETVMEFAIGKKRKAKVKKRPKLKERRQQKKSAKNPASFSGSGGADIEDADFQESAKTPAEKAELGLNIASGVMGAIGQTVGQIRASKADNSGGEDMPDYSGNKSSAADEETGIKKYMPYILGGVGLFVVGVLAYFVMKKKAK